MRTERRLAQLREPAVDEGRVLMLATAPGQDAPSTATIACWSMSREECPTIAV